MVNYTSYEALNDGLGHGHTMTRLTKRALLYKKQTEEGIASYVVLHHDMWGVLVWYCPHYVRINYTDHMTAAHKRLINDWLPKAVRLGERKGQLTLTHAGLFDAPLSPPHTDVFWNGWFPDRLPSNMAYRVAQRAVGIQTSLTGPTSYDPYFSFRDTPDCFICGASHKGVLLTERREYDYHVFDHLYNPYFASDGSPRYPIQMVFNALAFEPHLTPGFNPTIKAIIIRKLLNYEPLDLDHKFILKNQWSHYLDHILPEGVKDYARRF